MIINFNNLDCPKLLIILFFIIVEVEFPSKLNSALNGSFVHTTQADFLQGNLDKVSVTSDGIVGHGPELIEISGIKEEYVWCLVKDSRGSIYAGTGGEAGIIYKIENGIARKFCKLVEEKGIYAIAIDKDDNLYAATFPKPKIYKINQDGKADLFYKSDEEYIWCLAIDDKNNLYVGTGTNGKIFKINLITREEKLIFDSKETHILSFAIDKTKNIYAGTSDTGIVYKITQENNTGSLVKVSILYQIGNREIHTLCIDDSNNIYAGVSMDGSAIQSVRSVQQQGLPVQDVKTGVQQSTQQIQAQQIYVQQPTGPFGGSVYKITTDGFGSLFYQSSDPVVFSLIWHKDNLYAGTVDIKNNGMLYRINKNSESDVLAKNIESQIISIVGDSKTIFIGTATDGKVFMLEDTSRGKTGNFTSIVLDAEQIVRWGNISLNKNGNIEIETRTGNVKEPDDTWSSWYKTTSEEDQKIRYSVKVNSPAARFLQYRIFLSSTRLLASTKPAAEISSFSSIEVRYAGKNQSPEISSIQIAGDESNAKSKMITILWLASDPDKDLLIYDLYYKSSEEKKWKKLKTEIKENSYNLDSETIPDGDYFIKVVASDRTSNTKDRELEAYKISKQFFVDNTPPVVYLNVKLENKNCIINGEATDNLSIISKLEYSVDADKWIALSTIDEIFDSSKEKFSFNLRKEDFDSEEEHTIAVKATDSAGNISISKHTFNLKF